ncbi:DEKNAAC103907 [Brettanomyces naardenensis]|uniref:diacylglycerol O-acyltransferase n=1 Tax=Brettanomyces naardenensis TaxID=13370 RepID=A0A448YPH7_BRENA|nr:DEKNAAC103907 [Brettanomyces naardenensis]
MIRIPLKVPWKRRLETIVVMVHSTSLVLFTFLFFFLWCFPVLWPFMTIYTIFFFLLDRTPANGNSPRRYSTWVRNLGIYQYLSSYFPITLHKTVDLKPTFVTKSREVQVYNTVLRYILPDFVLSVLFRLYLIGKTTKSIPVRVRNGPRYVFGYHPHGVIAMGITGGFTMEGANFSNLFPGIRCFVTTLVNQFTLPFYRDYLMSLGVTSVTKKNLKSILRQDNSIVIVVGGATESLYSRPGLNTLVLRKRKGFIKLALEMCGVSDSDKFTSADDDIALVPVYGFGENNIYDVYYTNDSSNSSDGYIRRVLRYWQLWLKRKSGFTLPIVVSRGIFNYDFGVLPFRRPIDVVFGEPIAVKRMYGNKPGDAVTDEELAYYHGLYVEQLVRMFERNRGKYLTKWDKGLEIVDYTRRLQTLAVFTHASSIIVLPWLFFYLWTIPLFWPFLLYYTIFRYWCDKSLSNGANIRRKSSFVRNLPIYRYFCDYFPIRLHKTVDLIPTFTTTTVQRQRYSWLVTWFVPTFLRPLLFRLGLISKHREPVSKEVRTGPRYMFCYHPHGVIAFGITGAFVGEGLQISQFFPGIHCFLLTLINQFMLPFYRDYIMALGVGLVTRKGIAALLSRDQSVAIVIGGASESLLAKPGRNSIVLNRRKGFIKMALRMTGISKTSTIKDDEDDLCIVPVYGFGENDIYDVFYTGLDDPHHRNENERAWKRVLGLIQAWLKRKLGFTLPVIMSRGILNYDCGLLPYRRPVNVVFGRPIPIKRLYGNKPGDPVTTEEVQYYHGVYVKALKTLFADNKAAFLPEWDEDLKIIE